VKIVVPVSWANSAREDPNLGVPLHWFPYLSQQPSQLAAQADETFSVEISR